MTDERPAWPNQQIALDAVSRWVATVCGCEVGAPEILQLKRWGVTARFGSVVLKASFTPLFPQVTGAHAGGEGGFGAHVRLVGVGEEVYNSLSFKARWSSSATVSSAAHWCR